MQIQILISLLIFLGASFSQGAENYKLQTVCKNKQPETLSFFEKQKADIEKQLVAVRADVKKQAAFKDSDMYEWLRFTSPKNLGSLLATEDDNSCTSAYNSFVRATKKVESASLLTSWKNCILSAYRNAVPDMAEKLLLCHGVDKDELTPEEKQTE